jgi:hypothetical protein
MMTGFATIKLQAGQDMTSHIDQDALRPATSQDIANILSAPLRDRGMDPAEADDRAAATATLLVERLTALGIVLTVVRPVS